MIGLLIYLLVIFLLIGLIYWVIDAVPVPDPLGRIAKIVTVVIAAIVLIMLLLQLTGTGSVHLPSLK